eukprot:GHRR01023122.1.p1 GENE.GHRR01023122.1~~GHRR01023122.1.p1  ORF type:complete len:128 (+),score=40.13 GHRR01023122.1:136-519(+)
MYVSRAFYLCTASNLPCMCCLADQQAMLYCGRSLGVPAGQAYGQLVSMECDINRQLAAGQGDPEYWEAVLPRLGIHAAKARLRDIKAQLLEERLAAEEEKLDVAAAMGWLDEAEEETDQHERYVVAT